MKRKIFSILFALVLLLSLSLVTAAPVSAQVNDLAVNDENPWTDGAFTFENILPGGDPMEFNFKLDNVGENPGILTFSMSVSENDMAGAPAPNMSADAFASLIYVEAVHYQYIWLTDPEGPYTGSVRDDLPSWLGMDSEPAGGNEDGKVSLYEMCEFGEIPYADEEGDTLGAGAEITYFIEFQLGGSLEGDVAGGAILPGVDNDSQGDGVSVTIIATLGSDIEQSSGNVFQADGTAGPVLNDTTDVTYDTIQLAIDAASAGDTIIVHEGTYAGFNANKSVTIKAAPDEAPVISGTGISWGGHVVGVLVTADDVTIRRFKVTGPYSMGIWVFFGADDVQILGNIVDQTGFDPGALASWDGSAIASHGNDTLISNNRVKFRQSSKPHSGINILVAWGTTSCGRDSIIVNNRVTIFEHSKYQVGIIVRGNATIVNNRVVCPDKNVGSWTRVFGIWLYGLDGYSPAEFEVTVTKNTVTKTDYAIWVTGPKLDSDTVIEKNTLVNNGIGVILENGATPTIQNNRIRNSWWWDILYN